MSPPSGGKQIAMKHSYINNVQVSYSSQACFSAHAVVISLVVFTVATTVLFVIRFIPYCCLFCLFFARRRKLIKVDKEIFATLVKLESRDGTHENIDFVYFLFTYRR